MPRRYVGTLRETEPGGVASGKLLKMAIEIVDLPLNTMKGFTMIYPLKTGDIFHIVMLPEGWETLAILFPS